MIHRIDLFILSILNPMTWQNEPNLNFLKCQNTLFLVFHLFQFQLHKYFLPKLITIFCYYQKKVSRKYNYHFFHLGEDIYLIVILTISPINKLKELIYSTYNYRQMILVDLILNFDVHINE